MEKIEVKQLLQHYFDGTSSEKEEDILKNYFKTENVPEEFEEYKGFFNGISGLSEIPDDNIEDEIMDHILELEVSNKKGYRRLYLTIAGIAASLLIILGGILLRQQPKPFKDTFNNPEVAYNYATKTLAYVSEKYNSGIGQLAHFEKLQNAVEPLNQGIKTVNKFYDEKQPAVKNVRNR
jgi:hypothetical protein